MSKEIVFNVMFEIAGGDFVNAGEASCQIRNILKEIGIDMDTILRVTVAAYEAEMNVVMYARKGKMQFYLTKDRIKLNIQDIGPGIPDIDKALIPGYSTATPEMREMGFGAGMGLPNIRKNADVFNITSESGRGTKLTIEVELKLDD